MGMLKLNRGARNRARHRVQDRRWRFTDAHARERILLDGTIRHPLYFLMRARREIWESTKKYIVA